MKQISFELFETQEKMFFDVYILNFLRCGIIYGQLGTMYGS